MPKLSALTAKAAPTTADELIITDKADSNNTKRITINNLPLSAAAVSGLAAKAPTASPTFTGVISIPDGSAAAPSLSNTGDSNTGLYWSAADELSVATGGVQRAVVDSSGNLGVGTSTVGQFSSTDLGLTVDSGNEYSGIAMTDGSTMSTLAQGYLTTYLYNQANGSMLFGTNNTERMRLDSSGSLLVGKTVSTLGTQGTAIMPSSLQTTRDNGNVVFINRLTSDGNLVQFYQDTTQEGAISVSGTTVSYNGGHLARWSRMLDGSKPENLLKGTVMSNLDEMVEWAYDETPEVLWAAGDGLPEGVSVGDVKVEGKEATYWGELGEAVPGFAGDVKLGDVKSEAVEEVLWTETDGLPEGVSIGDVKVPYKPAGVEDNEQLNHTAISSVEADKDVAGVFIAWDDDDEYNDYHLAMVGDVVIRIAEGVEVQRGDLLVSAGDGTAKPQDDDLIRSSTIAKVTSKNVTCIYDDSSFCVPCVLK